MVRFVSHLSVRRVWVLVASAGLLGASLVALWLWSPWRAPAPDFASETRAIEEASGGLVVVDSGRFVFPDGDSSKITISEPLPLNERSVLDEALASVDLSSADARSQVANMLGDTMGPSGKPYIAIVPMKMSCGSDEFSGFAVLGSFPPVSDPLGACESMRTIEGARALADSINSGDPYQAGTYEIFDLTSVTAGASDDGGDTSLPPASLAPAAVPITLDEDQKQTYGGETE